MARNLLDLLSGGVVLFDGAMGTMLYERGVFINRSFDELNLSSPAMIERIHGEYVAAGADCIETNTFGANRFKLKLHGLDDRLVEINETAARIARRAAGEDILVAGAIGPLGLKIEPWGPTANEEAAAAFAEQARALVAGGVDCFVLETFGDVNEIHQAIIGVRAVSMLPVVAQMSLRGDGLGLYGTEPADFARRLCEWGADVVGVNCSVGPRITLEAIEKMAAVADRPLSAQPNAGVPQNVEGRNMYLVSPEYLAEYARRFVQAGARVVGGCCGTTPAHIRAIRGALKTMRSRANVHAAAPAAESRPAEMPSRSARDTSKLAEKIAAGSFISIVECVPPLGCDPSAAIASARMLAGAGIDAINIPDSPRSSSRMSPLALAVLIRNAVGIDVLLHYCCRDRNILGMQSDLLGAHALGLRNILIITGDPIRTVDYPDATAVFDVDSIGLTNIVSRLNHGKDIGDRSLAEPTSFLVGVGVNPGAVHFEEEMRRLDWKVKAGADFAVTQPVFDVELLLRFLDRIAPLGIPVIAGIWPLASYRNAEFINNELPGVSVPESILRRMKDARSGELALAEGTAIAAEILREIAPRVRGVQISAPFARYECAVEVIARGLGETNR
ncbi:MAG: bifunctional homocysteine S-methyltransferase/methylenetetrahydrofolate reductase [Candidatus Krumholzibacteria bacterium]|nr:bifunctional homocysteine S-methyltransferase/methylenetetrahydrofolate reductase [Candidatus Krumholzibacteria bacterium]